MKKIGVITSGGDAQGMNAAIFAVVRYAHHHGMEVYGIFDGYRGLINGEVKKLCPSDVENIIHLGGTVLGTSRCPEMKTEEGREKAVATLRKHGIEGLVVIGGDGSFQGARVLSVNYGINVVGIPGTIDNDLAYTDFTLGFDSATSVVNQTINQLRDTMFCNKRSCVVGVMGRHCGDIALYAALTTGAEAVIVPEVGYDLDRIIAMIEHNAKVGKHDNIIIVAEGVASADAVYKDIAARLPDLNIRPMTVGHIQRGGDATLQDRLLGVKMGVMAVECLANGETNRVIGIKNGQIFHQEILEALAIKNQFQMDLYNLANHLGEY